MTKGGKRMHMNFTQREKTKQIKTRVLGVLELKPTSKTWVWLSALRGDKLNPQARTLIEHEGA